jgi:hypothetical protein
MYCSLMYATCNEHVTYCHLSPAQLYNIFPHYLINTTILKKKKGTEHRMCVSLLFITWSETFFSLRRNERDMIKYVHRSSRKVPFILVKF